MVCGTYFLLDSASSFTVIRLCTETPTAGGRIFEKGDEYLLELAYKTQSAFSESFLLPCSNQLVILRQFLL